MDYLRDHGEATAAEVGEAVGIAPITARHHLTNLHHRGVLAVRAVPSGRGRPPHLYRIKQHSPADTESRASTEPNDSVQRLTSRILDIFAIHSHRAKESLFATLAEEALSRRRKELAAAPDEEARLDILVDILAGEGLQMRWEHAESGGGYVLHEIQCPFAELSCSNPEVCHMDMRIIEQSLKGEVERVAWRPDGCDNCEFRIRPAKSDANARQRTTLKPAWLSGKGSPN